MISVTLVVLAAAFGACATDAAAQACETRPLAFDVDQPGQLEPGDCRVRGDICNDCGSAPGEHWTFEAKAGELILITARSSDISLVLRLFDSTGGRVDYGGDTCTIRPQRWISADADRTYRVEVAESGFLRPRFGSYVIRAERVTTPVTCGGDFTRVSGDRVTLTWPVGLSPTPILEYAMTVRRDAEFYFVSLGDGGSSSCSPSRCERSFEAVPSGIYSYRLQARNALGWGPPSLDGSVTVTNGPRLAVSYELPRMVFLSWSDPSLGAPLSFELLVGASPGSTSLGIFDVSPSPYEIFGVGRRWSLAVANVPRGTYYVRVRAMTSAGPTEPSNEVVITVF